MFLMLAATHTTQAWFTFERLLPTSRVACTSELHIGGDLLQIVRTCVTSMCRSLGCVLNVSAYRDSQHIKSRRCGTTCYPPEQNICTTPLSLSSTQLAVKSKYVDIKSNYAILKLSYSFRIKAIKNRFKPRWVLIWKWSASASSLKITVT